MSTLKDKLHKERNQKMKKRILMQGSLGVSLLILCVLLSVAIRQGNGESKKEAIDSQSSAQNITESTDSQSSPQNTTEILEVETEALPEEEEGTLQIVMVGDMLMHTKIIDSGLQENGSYNFDHLFCNVEDTIDGADIAIVNQETIMGGHKLGYTGYPCFNSPYAIGNAEVKCGFNVILHATNHTLDRGPVAVKNCMSFWDTNHPDIAYLGINKSKEEQDNNIYVYEDNGIKVAILNYTYGTNGIKPPKDQPYIVNYMDKDKIVADIKKAKELADFVIVCPHWGTEYKFTVSKDQRYWTNIFFENGVDLVMGAHPHVIEPIEWIRDDEGNEMLVYYSLGNFVNGTSSTGSGVTNRMVGGIADVTIGRDESGEVVIMENDIIPIVCHVGLGDEYSVYYLEDYSEEMAQKNRILLQDPEFSKALCQSVVDSVWGE